MTGGKIDVLLFELHFKRTEASNVVPLGSFFGTALFSQNQCKDRAFVKGDLRGLHLQDLLRGFVVVNAYGRLLKWRTCTALSP